MSVESPAPRIHVLEEAVANQIAAGEVIERPASVVKELAENAVDAGATRVQVELAEGGRRLIRVVDNGEGMTAQEAVIALQRHATSKITQADDLLSIRTLGFRGEALPSIASVSRLTLVTRRRGALEGFRLVAAGGDILSLDPVGAPEGTNIAITDLFYNTPARLKFLKSPRTELGQACDAMTRIALAQSEVAVTLLHEGAPLLSSPGGELLNVITAVYGKELAREMVPVEWDRPGLYVRGFVARPTATRPTRSAQSFFVNGRFVRSRTLTHALDEAYRGTLPSGRFAAAVLRIEIDPMLVDVNVHPTKLEVRFLRDWEVHRAVHEAVRSALGVPGSSLGVPSLVEQSVLTQDQLLRGTWAPAGGEARLPEPPPDGSTAPPVAASERTGGGDTGQLVMADVAPPVGLRPIAQLWNSYILAESPRGLLIVDQHLAHERVLFQRLTQAADLAAGSQRLAVPLTFQATPREAVALEGALPELQALGYELEPFGAGSYVLRAAPGCLRAGDELTTLRALLEDVAQDVGTRPTSVPRERIAATAACKAAVKKGTRLALEEMRQLLEDLQQVEHTHTCPHGCPIAVELPHQELLKRFKRV